MYVSNLHRYGHLLNADNYETTHLHSDMYSLFENRLVSTLVIGMHYIIINILQDWERRYLHENWSKLLEDDYDVEQVRLLGCVHTIILWVQYYFSSFCNVRVPILADLITP